MSNSLFGIFFYFEQIFGVFVQALFPLFLQVARTSQAFRSIGAKKKPIEFL